VESRTEDEDLALVGSIKLFVFAMAPTLFSEFRLAHTHFFISTESHSRVAASGPHSSSKKGIDSGTSNYCDRYRRLLTSLTRPPLLACTSLSARQTALPESGRTFEDVATWTSFRTQQFLDDSRDRKRDRLMKNPRQIVDKPPICLLCGCLLLRVNPGI
jgi:hypothetical protein